MPIGRFCLSTRTKTSHISNDFILDFVENFSQFSFENRKEIVAIFTNFLRRENETKIFFVEQIFQRPNLLLKLIDGYENDDIALHCGTMLRESFRHQQLIDVVLKSTKVFRFFDFFQKSTFDVVIDAFVTFKVRLVFVLFFNVERFDFL